MRTVSVGVIVLLTGLNATASAQSITYDITWTKPNTHLFNVTMHVEHGGGELDVRIPAWRPGRYHMQNYSKDIISVGAATGGRELEVGKVDSHTWRIKDASKGTITLTYRSYARQMDAGSSYLDDVQAWINPITLLMYVPGRELEPVRLNVQKPEGWQVATALEADQDGTFPAADYHELVDNPILVSPKFQVLRFEEGGADYEIVLQGGAIPTAIGDSLVADMRRIVAEQAALMGIVPFDRYVVLANLVPHGFGHGVEHKNSTAIVMGPADFTNRQFYSGFLSVISHEFFHVWNVERIRPEAIYHPDYSVPNHTSTMWIYEGITSYYSGLAKTRAGFSRPENYIKGLGRLFQSYDAIPGRRVMSPAMTSWDSWVKQGQAPPNTYYSFYTVGQVLGVLIDLEIRGATENQKSLDDVMRYLYQEYYLQDRGVPEDGFERAIETVSGHSMRVFFDRYVYGTDSLDYNAYLKHAGLEVIRTEEPGRPSVRLGIGVSGDEKETRISDVQPNSPALESGLFIDDILLAIDGVRAHSANLPALLKSYAPGDTLRVSIFRRNRLTEVPVVLDGGANVAYSIFVMGETTELQDTIRETWLRTRVE